MNMRILCAVAFLLGGNCSLIYVAWPVQVRRATKRLENSLRGGDRWRIRMAVAAITAPFLGYGWLMDGVETREDVCTSYFSLSVASRAWPWRATG